MRPIKRSVTSRASFGDPRQDGGSTSSLVLRLESLLSLQDNMDRADGPVH